MSKGENEVKKYDVVALGELLIDFTENGVSGQGNPIYEANPGGAGTGSVWSGALRYFENIG